MESFGIAANDHQPLLVYSQIPESETEILVKQYFLSKSPQFSIPGSGATMIIQVLELASHTMRTQDH